MSPAAERDNIWTISEELDGLNMTGNSRKETLAERAKRFVGDALEPDEARDASAGNFKFTHFVVGSNVSWLTCNRVRRRADNCTKCSC